MFDASVVDLTTVYAEDDQKKRATLAYVIDGSEWTKRPDAEEVYVLDFADADILIPWPKEMTAKEAIIAWASSCAH